ncbi:hypothetical protein Tco_0954709 [Tanacetum coccineum]|uniref:Uncharacterized protein n=1 Tax=Tanacetum coccineum TaxID=301880 RepID=A0ABQ5E554_9ASTR
MERFQDNTPEGYNLMLWGDLKILVDPEQDDDIWKNQNQWKIISWKLYETCGVHTLMVDGTLMTIHMFVEKKYPLTKETLQKMLNWKLEAEAESSMAFELLKYREYDLAHLKLVFEFSICRYGVSKVFDTAYWAFLEVGTTFDIFQNLHILYLEYGVLPSSGYDVQRIENKAKTVWTGGRYGSEVRGTVASGTRWQWRLRGTIATRDPSQSLGSSRMVTCHLAIGGSGL